MTKPGTILADKLRWELLSPGDRVLAAVSGGPDSLCLLHVLWTEREARQLGSVEAAHLDHGLRGAEAAAEAEWVAAWCAEYGIVCHVGRADVTALAREQKCSIQEAARIARYAFLERIAAAARADKIATGHTQTDQAETVLANILRGTGLDGLRGIPERRGLIVRPLLDLSRTEVEAYNAENGLQPRQDSSNFSAKHYTRNRIRLELLPQLRREYNRGVDDALLRLSKIAARDSAYLAEQAAAALAAVTRATEECRLEMDRTALAATHPALLRYVLRQAVEKLRGPGGGLSHSDLEAACQAIVSGLPQEITVTHSCPRCRVQVAAQSVSILVFREEDHGHSLVFTPLPVPSEAALETLGWTVRATWEDQAGAARVDGDAVDLGSLHVRTWRVGDRMDPLGMGGRHKRVSDIFTDAKVPRAERRRIPMICDQEGIVWIAGHTLSERAKVTPSTTTLLFLSAYPVPCVI